MTREEAAALKPGRKVWALSYVGRGEPQAVVELVVCCVRVDKVKDSTFVEVCTVDQSGRRTRGWAVSQLYRSRQGAVAGRPRHIRERIREAKRNLAHYQGRIRDQLLTIRCGERDLEAIIRTKVVMAGAGTPRGGRLAGRGAR